MELSKFAKNVPKLKLFTYIYCMTNYSSLKVNSSALIGPFLDCKRLLLI